MSARVHSVNTSPPRSGIIKRPTGIDKRSTHEIDVSDPGPKGTGGSGVEGDAVMNRRHHGGTDQAVYAFAREELDSWGSEIGRDLAPGVFGENLTTVGFDVDSAVLGEQWRVGGRVVLQVTGPRVPCATFAAHMGVRGWVKAFTARGRTGAYLAVLQPGTIRAGDSVEVAWRPGHGITVPTAFRAWMGDRELARKVLAARALTPGGHDELAERLARWETPRSRTA